MSKKKLQEHNEEYAEIVQLYDDSQNENLHLLKSLNKIKPNLNARTSKAAKLAEANKDYQDNYDDIPEQSLADLIPQRQDSDRGAKVIKDVLSY